MSRGTAWAHSGRILRALVGGPKSASDVAQASGCAVSGTRLLLRQMRVLRLVHVAGWTRVTGARTGWFPLWTLGEAEDCPCPEVLRNRPINTAKPGADLIALAVALRAMEIEPQSIAMLVETTGKPRPNLGRGIHLLHRLRLLRIDHWERNRGGSPTAFYVFEADGKDAPRPKPITRKELWRAHETKRRERRQQLRLLHALAGRPFQLQEQA